MRSYHERRGSDLGFPFPLGVDRLPPENISRLAAKKTDEENEKDSDADERNVFYVALTRAKTSAILTVSNTDREGKEILPTQFIEGMKENVLSPVDVSKYEREIADHPETEFAAIAPKTPELRDKEFLNALFAEQGLSVTALNNYLECPWHIFYVNLVRIPEAPNKHLAFGNAVHAALKGYFDMFSARKKGQGYMVRLFEEGSRANRSMKAILTRRLRRAGKRSPRSTINTAHRGRRARGMK